MWCWTPRRCDAWRAALQVPDFALLDGQIEEAEREQQFSTDCHATPGERCLQPRGDNATRPSCEAMSCRGADTLLVNGEPCDDGSLPHQLLATTG